MKGHAHLQDFDFLPKKDLGLGQVLLVNAFDGHLPVSLLHNTKQEETDYVRRMFL